MRSWNLTLFIAKLIAADNFYLNYYSARDLCIKNWNTEKFFEFTEKFEFMTKQKNY